MRTEGMSAISGKVIWEMTPAVAKDLANQLERLVELEGERDLGGCLSYAVLDLRTYANEATQRRAGSFGRGDKT